MEPGMVVRRLQADEVPAAHALEALSYPADEAASLEGMTFRQANAPAFFYGLFGADGVLLGFVNGTCCREPELHHATMSQHDPAGATLCVHSVVIQPERRRQGLATAMLRAYVERVLGACPGVARVRLIAKAHNLGLYQRCGFRVLRLSPVVHGKDPWFEMGLDRLSVLEAGRPFVQVDAFTDHAFGGNPAAVVFCEGDESAEWMQNWAREINLSETSFIHRIASPSSEGGAEQQVEGEEEHVYSLRWFTPLVEVDLCGHATLASAHALWVTGRVPPHAPIAFETKSGRLTATRKEEEESDGGKAGAAAGTTWIWLDFPAEPASPMPRGAENNYDFQHAFDAFLCEDEKDIVYIGRNRFDLLVVLTRAAFHRLAVATPHTSKLEAVACRGIIATCQAEPGDGPPAAKAGEGQQQQHEGGFDFLSRFFAPRCGIIEDPVTGSAHCCLATYWAGELKKTTLRAYQASRRGGILRIELDEARGRVHLGGQAVLVQQGFLGC